MIRFLFSKINIVRENKQRERNRKETRPNEIRYADDLDSISKEDHR